MIGYKDHYRAWFDDRYYSWAILDYSHPEMLEREPGTILPDAAITWLPVEAVIALLKAVADTDLVSYALSKKLYDRDMANRHLDIIESLVKVVEGKP